MSGMAGSSVIPPSETYHKGDGQAIAGFLYEIDLYNLVMLRCLKKKQKFHLAANYSEVKGFDDVVARIQTGDNKSAAIFLQAKHIKETKKLSVEDFQKRTKEEKKRFREIKILSYFNDYKECVTKFKSDAASPIFRTSGDEDVEKIFVHYTNLDIDDSMLPYFEISTPGDLEPLVLTAGKQPTARVLKLNVNGQNAIKIEPGEDEMLENFCKNFRLIVCQATEIELKEQILLDELPCIVAENYKKDILRQILVESQTLWQRSEDNFATDEKNTVHDVIMRQYFIDDQKNPLNENLRFEKDAVKAFYDFIKDNNFVSVQASSQEQPVYFSLISQAAEAIAPATGVAETTEERVIVVDTETCNSMWEIIRSRLESKITFLVITCKELEIASHLFDKLPSLKMHNESKVIIMHCSEANLTFDILNAPDHIRYKAWKNAFEFSWLTKECQSRILDKTIDFQGNDETIRDVLGTSTQILDINFLSSVLTVDKMKIGIKTDGLGPVSEYYISRDFEPNEEHTRKKPRSITTSELLKKCINQKGKKKSKFTVITGEAGTGKSTEMKKMSEVLQQDGRKFWVVLVVLNDLYEDFKSTKKFDVGLALELLSNHIQKDFGRSVFHSFCLETEKVVLLLDGFDEIETKYRDSLQSFISALNKTKINQVIVTTRPHVSPKLEGLTNKQELNLTRFSNENIDTFFKTYFKKVVKENKVEITEDIERKIAQFVCAIKKSLDSEFNNIIDIPLQARMIAEINMKNLLKYLNLGSTHVPLEKLIVKISNIKELYDKFFEGKLQIYLNEKLKFTERQIESRWDAESYAILNFHMKYAAQHIFPDTTEPKIFDLISLDVKGTECDESFGIIEKLEGNKIKFLHRTFAEYFCSRLIVRRMRSDKEDGCLFNFLLGSIIVSKEFKIVRKFLDYVDLEIGKEKDSLLGYEIREVSRSQESKSIVLHLLLEENLFNIFFFLMKYLKSESTESTELVREILELKNSDQNTCLFYAAKSSSDATRKLLEYKVDVNVVVNYGTLSLTNDGKGPVIHVAKNCEVLELLINSGANVHALDDGDMTALESFTSNGNFEMVKYLIDTHYSSLTTSSEDIGKALIVAVESNCLEIAKMLVTDGKADLSVKNKGMETLLQIAAREGYLEVVRWLVEDAKAEINERDRFGRTPLHKACWEGKLDVVRFLAAKAKDVYSATAQDTKPLPNVQVQDVNIQDNESKTPLHYAANTNNVEIIDLLVKCGANVNACDTEELTALHIAARGWHLNVVIYLIEKCNADVNKVCKNGNTPLHTLLKYRDNHKDRPVTRLEVVEYLVGAGANLSCFNNEGQTPLDLAGRLWKSDKLVSYLKKVIAMQSEIQAE